MPHPIKFGAKVSFATTNQRCKVGQFVLGGMSALS